VTPFTDFAPAELEPRITEVQDYLGAREDRHWLILMFHYLVEQPAQDTDYRRADFERLLALVEQTGARVLPLIDVFEACGAPATATCRLPARAAASAPR
jgi:hypothetical protein